MPRQTLRGAILAVILILSGSSAFAQITAVGPFSGTISETWESFNNYTVPVAVTNLPNPTSIFGGAASISNSFMTVYQPTAGATFGLGANGQARVSDGVKALGINNGSSLTTITFASDVSAFGGYWGYAAGSNNVAATTLSFFDAGGTLLGSQMFLYDHTTTADGILDWHGWQFTGAGIRSIQYGGQFMANDGLQAIQVAAIPEPEIYAMLTIGLGLIGWAGRRKKLKEAAAA